MHTQLPPSETQRLSKVSQQLFHTEHITNNEVKASLAKTVLLISGEMLNKGEMPLHYGEEKRIFIPRFAGFQNKWHSTVVLMVIGCPQWGQTPKLGR